MMLSQSGYWSHLISVHASIFPKTISLREKNKSQLVATIVPVTQTVTPASARQVSLCMHMQGPAGSTHDTHIVRVGVFVDSAYIIYPKIFSHLSLAN